ncbi:hypothetical protein [Pseudomonas sp. PDM16]|uniref:hypothetical protein n=1 Tax=Pseudomonas sp. PDM16 TaxID=2769292 RepID=UPI00399BA90A
MNAEHENLRAKLSGQVEIYLSKGGEITAVPTGKTGVPDHQKKPHWNRGFAEKSTTPLPTAEPS